MCGGTTLRERRASGDLGLSPRVRGNHDRGSARAASRGSIPACAGEPGRRGRARLRVRVYPRVCGGTVDAEHEEGELAGLSPRVRGNHTRVMVRRTWSGSIPACAGEPDRRCARPYRRGVYPRVCGGTGDGFPFDDDIPGLSPRVRGNPRSPCSSRPPDGSIPACAGEPISPVPASLASRVYPRVCGGTLTGQPDKCLLLGLSPRVRGNRYKVLGDRVGQGSIPACAGEPRSHCRWQLVS